MSFLLISIFFSFFSFFRKVQFQTVEQLASQSLEEFIEAEQAIITFYAKIGAEDNAGGRPVVRHSTPTIGSAMQGGQKQQGGQGHSMQMPRSDTDTDRMIERMEQLVREDLFNNKPPATLASKSTTLFKLNPSSFLPFSLKILQKKSFSAFLRHVPIYFRQFQWNASWRK